VVPKRVVAPIVACVALAVPAGASAHARTATVALDYRLVLDEAGNALPGVDLAVLDGDRDLRVRSTNRTLTVLGDLGEPMLRIGPAGAFASRSSPTANAAKLTKPGSGWERVGGSSFAWHDHRLAPPPYADDPGPAGRFRIPARLDGRPVAIAGTFVRAARPGAWPWLAGGGVVTFALVVLARARPGRRRLIALVLGALAGLAALTALVTFNAADAPNGRVAWAQIVLGCALAAVATLALARLRGERQALLAGVLGVAAAVSSLGSIGVFRHGVVVSLLSAPLARLVAAAALSLGVAAGATLFLRERSPR
jgi:hypothetical protein